MKHVQLSCLDQMFTFIYANRPCFVDMHELGPKCSPSFLSVISGNKILRGHKIALMVGLI